MSLGIPWYAVTIAAAALSVGSLPATTSTSAANNEILSFTATSTTLTAVAELSYFPLGPIIPLPVTISRVVNGTAQVVASGKGSVTYQCQGTAVNTYTAVGKTLTVPCG